MLSVLREIVFFEVESRTAHDVHENIADYNIAAIPRNQGQKKADTWVSKPTEKLEKNGLWLFVEFKEVVADARDVRS